jgi:hypothetical protein
MGNATSPQFRWDNADAKYAEQTGKNDADPLQFPLHRRTMRLGFPL